MSEITNPSNTAPQNSSRKLIFVLLICIIVLGIATFSIWQYFASDAMQTEIADLHNKFNQQQNIVQELESAQTKTTQQLTKKSHWEILEIARIIKIADLTLTTTGDVKTTINLLSLAKQYAAAPEFSAINYALSKDIMALQTVSAPDVEKLVSQLDAISQQANKLQLLPQKINPVRFAAFATPQLPIWKQFMMSSMAALKNIVIIRHQPIEPLPAPEQLVTVRLNIETKLAQAEWAVIHRNNDLYQTALQQVSTWIKQYFTINSQDANKILQLIKEIQNIDVAPHLPGINNSLRALEEFSNTIELPPAKSPTSEGAKHS